jgi:hypothetical protein
MPRSGHFRRTENGGTLVPRWTALRFASSATKHGISHERAQQALAAAVYEATVGAPLDPRWSSDRILFVGWDEHGIPLEVIALEEDDGALLVVHAMKLRPAYRFLLGGRR